MATILQVLQRMFNGQSDFELGYFQVLVTEYKNLGTPGDANPIDQIAKQLGEKDPHLITWSDIQTLEFAILQLQPVIAVRRRLINLREQYRKLVGQAEFDAYLNAAPDASTAPDPAIVADACQLLRQLHWTYTTTRARERLRRQASIFLALVTVLFVIAVCLSGYHYYPGLSNVPLVLVIMTVSVLGAFVSAQRRIQTVPDDGDPVLSVLQLENGTAGILLAPISGAIFGVILYLIFTGHLVQGELFPKINSETSESITGLAFRVFSLNTGPATGLDFAKLLVWSFVAGFAERFVPDVLDRLIAKSSEGQSSNK
jgi:hypothetical protein